MPPRPHQGDFPELPGVEVFLFRLDVVLARALLHPHLADALVQPGRLDDLRSLFVPQRQRLLDVNVLARV